MRNPSLSLHISPHECEFSAVRSQGAGGQNVNKVSSAIHLRFNIRASSLPESVKQRLLQMHDRRLTDAGEIVLKAQQHRRQEQNREEALRRLEQLVRSVAVLPPPRKATRPTRSSRKQRLEGKLRRGRLKALRNRVFE
ncbi:MAG: aminoacyl-tRNA hydrolase [Nevskiales bacterium]|nr:aminoacyl-tRNA hydrolase [Nevskiales bacterium]